MDEKKLPEMTIGCPACNDRERRMTIFFKSLNATEYYARCPKCTAIFILKGIELIQKKEDPILIKLIGLI